MTSNTAVAMPTGSAAHLAQIIVALAQLPLRAAGVVCGANDEGCVDATSDLDDSVDLNDSGHVLHRQQRRHGTQLMSHALTRHSARRTRLTQQLLWLAQCCSNWPVAPPGDTGSCHCSGRMIERVRLQLPPARQVHKRGATCANWRLWRSSCLTGNLTAAAAAAATALLWRTVYLRAVSSGSV